MPRFPVSLPRLSALGRFPGSGGETMGESREGWKRVLESTSYSLFLLGFITLGMVPGVSNGALWAAALLLIPGAILSRQPNPSLYGRAWNLATLLFMLGSLAFARWNQSTAIQTLAHLCVFLQIHKAFNYRTPRDYFQIWTLSLMMFLLVPLSVVAPPVSFGFLLFGFLIASVWHFGALGWRADARPVAGRKASRPGLFGRLASASAGDGTEPEWRGGMEVPVSRGPGGVGGFGSFGSAWRRLALAGLAITLVAFFCLPRPILPPALRQAESAEESRARQSLMTGFSQSIDLRQLSSLRLDATEAVRLRGSPLLRMGPVRLRAGTLDWFDGDRWEHTTSFGGGIHLPRRADPPEFRLNEESSYPGAYLGLARVKVDAKDFPFRGILALPGTVGVGGISGEIWLNDDGTMATWPGSPAQYLLYVRQGASTELASSAAAVAMGEGSSERYLQVHERLDPGWLRSTAAGIAEGAETDQEKARRVETYLKRQGEYSLDLRGLAGSDGSDALRRFIASPRPEGHCELFASAMALLCRSLDLPSRVATGFLGGTYDEREEELVMRYQDAHAWVEVWIPDRGWMSFDPTPPAPLVSFSERLPFLQIREWMGGIVEGWRKIADGYGSGTQRRAFAWIGERMDRWISAVSPFAGDSRAMRRIGESLRDPLFRWVASALFAINIAAIALLRRRRRARGLFASSRGDAARAAPSTWTPMREALAAAAGAAASSPPPGLTFGEYLAVEARENGVAWEPLARALAVYERSRFGLGRWAPDDARDFADCLKGVSP